MTAESSGAETFAPGRLAMSVAEFEEATGLSHSYVYEQIRTGKLRTARAGRRRLIPVAAANEWLNQLEASA